MLRRCKLLWLAHLADPLLDADATPHSAVLRPRSDSVPGALRVMMGGGAQPPAAGARLPPSAQHAQHASHYRGDVSDRGALVDALRSLHPGAPLQAGSGARSRGGTEQGEVAKEAVEKRLAEAAMRRADAAAFEAGEDRRTKARLAT